LRLPARGRAPFPRRDAFSTGPPAVA